MMFAKILFSKHFLKKHLTLLLIFCLSAVLRLYNLSLVPPSPSLDEVSIGYNAFSILKTGSDEYGNYLPSLLRAYDDFRPALYVYLVIPFIQLFDLSVLAVRLPSVILSFLTVFSTYFLTKTLVVIGLKTREKAKTAEILAQITTLLLTISPWHIYLSRLGHEVNAGLAFFIFGLTFFLRKHIVLGLLFFTFSFMSYQAEKVFIPLFVLVLFVLFFKEFPPRKKQIFFGCVACLIIVLPLIRDSFAPNALIRFSATNALTSQQDRFQKEAFLFAKAKQYNDIFGQIIHNRRTVSLAIVAENYFSHFNPFWLFGNISEDKHKVPNLGLLYLWEAPFILVGLFFLLKAFTKKIFWLIILWMILSPLPGAITTNAPHAMRSYTFLPTWQFIAGIGIYMLYFHTQKIKAFTYLFLVFFCIVIFLSVGYFSYNYYVVFPKTWSASFQYAMRDTMRYVFTNANNKKVVFSNENNLYQSYMFFLFYSKFDPFIYLSSGGTKSGGFAEKHYLSKYEFRPIDWLRESAKGIYIGNINDFPKSIIFSKTFANLDGKPVIGIVEK